VCLYRIVQEALRNVVRHTGRDHATVELTGTTAEMHRRVSDGGAGFDSASALRNGRLGLVGLGSGCTWSAAGSPSTPGRVAAPESTPGSPPHPGEPEAASRVGVRE
jgi:hypothetical protein